MADTVAEIQSAIGTAYSAVRRASPLVQCVTNTVVAQFSANVLLAMGTAPAMFDHEADAAEFARVADGLLINFGTATNHQFLGAEAAIDGAQDTETPWVLDPVSLGVGDYRSSRIRAAARRGPTVVRGNASEIVGLAGLGGGARGTDAVDTVESALPAAAVLSRRLNAVVAISGSVDAVVDATHGSDVRIGRVAGGHELMPLVIGTGCALGAAVAAYSAAASAPDDCFTAVIAAHAHFAQAGAMAGREARGPGSFAPAFLDALYLATPEDLAGVDVTTDTVEFSDIATPAPEAHA